MKGNDEMPSTWWWAMILALGLAWPFAVLVALVLT